MRAKRERGRRDEMREYVGARVRVPSVWVCCACGVHGARGALSFERSAYLTVWSPFGFDLCSSRPFARTFDELRYN